ncbi:MAG: YceI family protein [Armatimonadota bacterium]|nr:YceI family protein [Armatimonadota bacterium]MDR5696324.1 YceI family protein [Armatimonadota bacterium]
MRSLALIAAVVLLAGTAHAQLLATGTFVVSGNDSRVEMFVRDNVGGFSARAREVEGQATVRQTGERSFVADLEVRVPARSITTGFGPRDAQMHRETLQTERFPAIVFVGSVTTDAARVLSTFPAVAHGRLTLRGTTRQVSVPVRITPLPDGFRGRGEFEIKMSDFGIPVPRFLFFVAEDAVKVTVDLLLRSP